MAAATILDCQIRQILLADGVWWARRITVLNFVKICHSVVEILRFFEFSRWLLPLSWIFEIAKFCWLLGSMHQRVKFRQNRSIGCEDIKILRFFKMAAVRHLGFVWGIFEPPTVSTRGSLSLCKIWFCSSFYNMNISIFDAFGWKTPLHAYKIGVFGQFDPLNWLQYQRKPKKAHPCLSPRHLSH